MREIHLATLGGRVGSGADEYELYAYPWRLDHGSYSS